MSESSQVYDGIRAAQRNGRHLSIDGTRWLVYELSPMPFDRRSSPSLIFESDMALRRVRDFPADWRTLSDAQLFALSWSA